MHKKLYTKGAVRLSDAEVRQAQLHILDCIDEFCRKNSIPYSLSSGSLIGAVRHKGFIPWDDDIDILMLRKDYDKFLATFNGNYENLETLDYISEPDYCQPFAKVMDMGTQIVSGGNRIFCYGVNVDVFPVDGHPDAGSTPEYYRTFMDLFRQLHKSCPLYRYTSNPFVALKFLVRNIFHKGNREAAAKMEEMLRSYDFEACEYAGEATGDSYMKAVIPKEVFESFADMPFEGRSISCLTDYHRYLSAYYNDYMKFPPVEEQKPQHRIKAYRISR
ncbi:MAG: LicD family protein [Bacteroidales bacterium]|nr:LicD family protein [Bacteroidales bacterium]